MINVQSVCKPIYVKVYMYKYTYIQVSIYKHTHTYKHLHKVYLYKGNATPKMLRKGGFTQTQKTKK